MLYIYIAVGAFIVYLGASALMNGGEVARERRIAKNVEAATAKRNAVREAMLNGGGESRHDADSFRSQFGSTLKKG